MKLFTRTRHQTVNERGFGHVELIIAVLFIGIVAFIGVRVLNASHAATACAPSLVNPCRPLVGAAVSGYSMVASDKASQFAFANKRLNNANVLTNPSTAVTLTNQLDVVHTYHPVGSNTLSSYEISAAKTPNTFLVTNYKPTDNWASAGGSDASVNANIKQMADSVKSLGSTKILFVLYHEPENNVSVGNCAKNASGAGSGSPTDYVNMWHNVRKIFDQEGVSNVLWGMNYMGFANWNCLVKPLWPGDSFVDWILWDNYGHGTTLYSASVKDFYNLLSTTSDSTHSFTSKSWGLGEFGYGNSAGNSTQPNAIAYWNDAQSAIKNNTFPKLKLYDVFDTNQNGSSQVGLDLSGNVSIAEQLAYNAWANAIFTMTSTTPPVGISDKTAPSVSITSPAKSATLNGTIVVSVSTSDNVGVTRVVTSVDGTVQRDANATNAYGWGTRWDTTAVSNGTHTLTAVAYDAAGNKSTSSVTVNVSNVVADKTAPVVAFTTPVTGDSLGKVSTIKITATDNVAVTRVVTSVDGTVIRDASAVNDYGWGTRWDTTAVSNGTHTLTAVAYDAAGNTTTATSVVKVVN